MSSPFLFALVLVCVLPWQLSFEQFWRVWVVSVVAVLFRFSVLHYPSGFSRVLVNSNMQTHGSCVSWTSSRLFSGVSST